MNAGDEAQDTVTTTAITSLQQLREKIEDIISSVDNKILSLPENKEKQFLRGFRDGLARSIIECDRQIITAKESVR